MGVVSLEVRLRQRVRWEHRYLRGVSLVCSTARLHRARGLALLRCHDPGDEYLRQSRDPAGHRLRAPLPRVTERI
jgi:hypothetical protein